MHKAGFVNIGKPNAGKSTLLNQLMGEKLAIVIKKHKPPDIEFSGFITKKMYKLYFLIHQEF